jgi:UDP-glucose 4-epimerase
MNILITGALGYVGGRLVKYLSSNENCQIFASSRIENEKLADIVFPKNVEIINFNRGSENQQTDLLKRIDVVIHLAALNEVDCVRFPEEAIKVNVTETYKLLTKAIQCKVKRFIYFSTAHIYGAPLIGNIDENTLPRPSHPYSITHKAAEDFVLTARDKNEIEAIVIRLSNSFGAPAYPTSSRWTLLVNDLCKQAILNKKLVLKSDGTQFRDFICLEDVCRATDHLIKLSGSETYNGIFNLGGNLSLSVLDMTKIIQERYEHLYSTIIPIEKPEPGPKQTLPEPLSYKIDRLLATEFNLSMNINNEIDDMLNFCTINKNSI